MGADGGVYAGGVYAATGGRAYAGAGMGTGMGGETGAAIGAGTS